MAYQYGGTIEKIFNLLEGTPQTDISEVNLYAAIVIAYVDQNKYPRRQKSEVAS
jgi:hypothetical protein